MILADGASIHTVKWIQGLSLGSNWDLYLVTMNPAPFHPELLQIPQLKECHRCAPKRIYSSGNNFHYVFQVPKILRLKNRIRPDLINTVYLTSYGVVGALIRGSSQLCHFTIGTDIMQTPERGWTFSMLTRFALWRAGFIFSVSNTMTEKLVRDFKVSRQQILTQTYGISDWVIEYGRKEKRYDVVCARMWIPNSNVDWILSLIKDLPKNIKLALVGDVVAGEEDLGQRILTLAEGTPGVSRLGVLPYEKNIDVTASSEFFVSLTRSDGAPSSLLEAMALGAIPIVSDTAPNREWVTHGENGFLVPLDDRDLALKVFREALSTPPNLRDEMRQINKEIVRNRGSFQKNMTRALEHLEWPSGATAISP